jgi:DNA (cytosine-5)-methyltransferase 1
MEEVIRVFDMFSGYGGAEFALKKAGINHECIGFSEIKKHAIKCFETNHPGIKNFGDCTNIKIEELPNFDLLTGGFPCQPFSEAGKHKGELDTRGTLFYDIIRIAEAKNPRYMLLENVRGLTSKPHKETFDKILSELDRIGYKVYWEILNSKEHGTPQNRERIVFVCFRKDIDSGFKFPDKEELKIFLKDLVEQPTEEILVSVAWRNKNRSLHQAKGLPYGTFPKEYHYQYYKDIGISFAVKSALHEFMVGKIDDLENARFLTPKECFRLMGFFNDEIKLDGLSNSQKYDLAGNGWDVNLISKIFKQMFNLLN